MQITLICSRERRRLVQDSTWGLESSEERGFEDARCRMLFQIEIKELPDLLDDDHENEVRARVRDQAKGVIFSRLTPAVDVKGRPFEMTEGEVTQLLYEAVMGESPSYFKDRTDSP